MRNVLLEESYAKCSGEIIPRPFSKKSKLIMSLDQESKVLYSLFLFYDKLREIYLIYLNQAADHLLLHHLELF